MRKRFIRGLLKLIQLIVAVIIVIPFVIAFLAFLNQSGMRGTKPLLLGISFFLIFLYLNIFLHELGHVIAARLARMPVSKVMIGTGREIVKVAVLGFPWVITNNPIGGYTFISEIEGRYRRFRLLLFSGGGAFLQAFCILICIVLIQIHLKAFVICNGVDLLAIFIISSLPVLYSSLVPGNIPYKETKIPTDMLHILKLLLGTDETLKQLQAKGLMDEAFKYFTKKDYGQSAELLGQCVRKYPGHINAKIGLSATLIKLMKLRDAKELLISLLEEKHDDAYNVLIYSNIAWLALLENDAKTLVEADLYSKRAFEINPDLPSIRGIRGCVLILQGDVDEGIDLLLKNVRSSGSVDRGGNHPFWFCFIAYAYFLKGDKEKVRQYLESIRDFEKWDPDEKYLYELVKIKAKNFE